MRTYREAGAKASKKTLDWLLNHAACSTSTPLHIGLRPQFHNLIISFQLRAWVHIGGSANNSYDEIMAAQQPWSLERKLCFRFFNNVLSGSGSDVEAHDLWTPFGFCVFDDRVARPLRLLYQTLFKTCTFNDFCDSFTTSSLIALMDR